MSDSNPIVKDTAQATHNAAIESLQLLTTLLDNSVKQAATKEELQEAHSQDDEKHLTTAEMAGLSHQLKGICSAMEVGYGQYNEQAGNATAV
jgi:hypothetical protein